MAGYVFPLRQSMAAANKPQVATEEVAIVLQTPENHPLNEFPVFIKERLEKLAKKSWKDFALFVAFLILLFIAVECSRYLVHYLVLPAERVQTFFQGHR